MANRYSTDLQVPIECFVKTILSLISMLLNRYDIGALS